MPTTSFPSEVIALNEAMGIQIKSFEEAQVEDLNFLMESINAMMDALKSETRDLRWTGVVGVAIVAAAGFFG